MRTKLRMRVIGFSLFCMAAPVAAHHSWTAEYDGGKPVSVKGVITKVEWTNPHTHFYVETKDEKGTVTTWNFEMASTLSLERGGWSRKTLQVGDAGHDWRLRWQGRDNQGRSQLDYHGRWQGALRREAGTMTRMSSLAVGRVVVVSVALAAPLLPGLAGAQELGRRLGGANGPPPAAAAPDRPVPRLPDGTVDLSGVWMDGGSGTIESLLKPGELESIMLPWAKKVFASRTEGQDPYNYCMPGGPLRITGGFAWRFVQHPTTNATHIFMLQEGNAHTYRQIFMDGRKHPEDPDADLVRALDRAVGSGHARHRHGRPSRQVLAR